MEKYGGGDSKTQQVIHRRQTGNSIKIEDSDYKTRQGAGVGFK